MTKADIGLVGLAVMGENLALNIASRGFRIAVFNRTVSKVDHFLATRAAGQSNIIGVHSLEELVASLTTPRRILLMVKAGAAVDELVKELLPLLHPGDIILDGGNSHFLDTQRRVEELASRGMHFLGVGISGGEEGALKGPSIMPGGSEEAWPQVRAVFESIAARANGEPCCAWMGKGGAGHFVKMVHNGIEYGDMQLIAEVYWILRQGLGKPLDEISGIFARWNETELQSYLIEITAAICRAKESASGQYWLDLILDRAGEKGTGKWVVQTALDLGVPLNLIGEAVFARFLSAQKAERLEAAQRFRSRALRLRADPAKVVEELRQALYAAKICSYAQGFALLTAADRHYHWGIQPALVARVWRAGCIIRAKFLDEIAAAFEEKPDLPNLLMSPRFSRWVRKALPAWRRVVSQCIRGGLPVPALASALEYFDGYRSAESAAHLIQAQRDYFGAHQVERVDRAPGEFFHIDWSTAVSTPQGG